MEVPVPMTRWRGKPQKLPNHVRNEIHRIGGRDEDPLKTALHDRRHDLTRNFGGFGQDVHPVLPRLRIGAYCQDDDVDVGAVRIGSCVHGRPRMRKIDAMRQVQRLGKRPVVCAVDHHDLVADGLVDHRVSAAGSDHAGAYDGNSSSFAFHVSFAPSILLYTRL